MKMKCKRVSGFCLEWGREGRKEERKETKDRRKDNGR